MNIKRNLLIRLSTYLYNTHSSFAIPTSLGICLTNRCNITCPYCMRHEFTPQGDPMTLESLQHILKKLPSVTGVCIMGLCEPFLNPHIYDILRWLHESGYSISLTTNGTVPIKDLSILECVDDFVISMDTNDPDTFRYLRGGASLDKVFNTFKQVIEYKRSKGLTSCDNPPLHINAVITKKNLDQLTGLMDMLEPYAADLTYLMVDPISRPDYQHFEEPLALTEEETHEQFASYKAYSKTLNLEVIGFDYMFKPSNRWSHCHLSWYGMFVQPNGDCYFCYDYRRVLGNLFKSHPLLVWNSKIARAFRKQLTTNNPPIDQCKCCNFARSNWQPDGDYTTQGKIKHDVG